MKLSISLPDNVAKEIRRLARETDRSISWWIQRAWTVAREQLRNPENDEKAEKAALSKLRKLQGALKDDYPNKSSVELSHNAFGKEKK
jgi:uncharacterized small protein (TIGR04563 family)